METDEIKNENNNITDAKTELPPDVVSILFTTCIKFYPILD